MTTSPISERTRAPASGSAMTSADSSGVSHCSSASSSPTSPARAIARFFGVWNRSQSRAATNSRSRPASSSIGVVTAPTMPVDLVDRPIGTPRRGDVRLVQGGYPSVAPVMRGVIMRGYAVVDVETTGLYAGGHHRIIEVAVVHVDPSGEVTGEWATLVNPRRDLGPAAIHGIRAADVRKAPPFATIAPTLASLLAERTMVAHNLPFDAGFLAAEYGRMGFHPPLAGHQGLCTMRMAVDFLPGSQRSLAACCHAASVPLNDQHEALSD